MIIQIKRIFINSGLEVQVLINTRYVIEVKPSHDPDKPQTMIVYDSLRRDDVAIMYTSESINGIKGKITKASKLQSE